MLNFNNSCIVLSIIFISLLHPPSSNAQNSLVTWVDAHAKPLSSDSTAVERDFLFLSEKLKGKTIVGLGEASHGTQEFFFQKRRIIQYLVAHADFRTIAFESAANFIEPINRYIQSGEGNLKSMLAGMGLYNASEIFKLFQWLMQYNASRPASGKVTLIGFDDEAFWADPLARDELMAGKFIAAQKADQQKSILWSHNMHLAKDTTMAQYKGMGFHLKAYYGTEYYALGFDTYSGSVHVLNDGQFESHEFAGNENTYSALFNKSRFDSFFIDFTTAPESFRSANYITNIYSNWQERRMLPIIPGADFDGLIFIRKTTASKL